GNAHRVPENHIAVDERAVRLDPPRQPIASTSLIHELAGRVLLGRVIGGDPQVRLEEAGPHQQGRVGQGNSELFSPGSRTYATGWPSTFRDPAFTIFQKRLAPGSNWRAAWPSRTIGVSVTRAAVTVRGEPGAIFTSRTVLAGPSTSMSRRKLNQC